MTVTLSSRARSLDRNREPHGSTSVEPASRAHRAARVLSAILVGLLAAGMLLILLFTLRFRRERRVREVSSSGGSLEVVCASLARDGSAR
jgi:hypothetical protein